MPKRCVGLPRDSSVSSVRRGIILKSALWILCRCRHNAHWVGAPHRLNRDLKGRFGDESYAAEELIAELGAAFLCAALGVENQPRPDHAAYVQNWLRVLRNDNRAIFTAASQAQAAAEWLHSLQFQADSSPTEHAA